MVLQRPLVLEIGTTNTQPAAAAVLLVGPPVAFHGEALAALPACKPLCAMLPLVMGLEGSEVLEGFGPGVVYVVLATFFAAVAWDPLHGSWL